MSSLPCLLSFCLPQLRRARHIERPYKALSLQSRISTLSQHGSRCFLVKHPTMLPYRARLRNLQSQNSPPASQLCKTATVSNINCSSKRRCRAECGGHDFSALRSLSYQAIEPVRQQKQLESSSLGQKIEHNPIPPLLSLTTHHQHQRSIRRRIGDSIDFVAKVSSVSRPSSIGVTRLKLETEFGDLQCHAVAPPVYESEAIRVRGNWQLQPGTTDSWCVHVGAKLGGQFTQSQRDYAEQHNIVYLEDLEFSIRDPLKFLLNFRGIGEQRAFKIYQYAKQLQMSVFELIESDQFASMPHMKVHMHKDVNLHSLPLSREPQKISSDICLQWNRSKTLRSVIRLLARACEGMEVDHYHLLLCAQDLYEKFDIAAKTALLENPYSILATDHPLPLLVAESLALRHPACVPSLNHRLEGHALAYIRQRERSGHSHIPLHSIISSLMSSLPQDIASKDAILEAVQSSTELLLKQDQDGQHIIRKRLAHITEEVSSYLSQRKQRRTIWRHDELDLEHSQRMALLSLHQKTAIAQMLRHNISVLTGFPGTGKTTLIAGLVHVLQAAGKEVRLVAPTGRAATRITAAIGSSCKAETIHSFARLGIFYDFHPPARSLVNVDAIIVDESSMLSVEVAYGLLKAIPPETAIYFIGDPDQLPPVGACSLLNIISQLDIEPIKLSEIHRQHSSESHIQIVARKIVQGNADIPIATSIPSNTDFAFLYCKDEDLPERIVDLVTREIPEAVSVDPLHDIQVLTPLRTRGHVSARQLNLQLQQAFQQRDGSSNVKAKGGFFLRDKVLQTVNNRGQNVFNGEMGVVSAVYNRGRHAMDVKFQQGFISRLGNNSSNSRTVVAYSPFELQSLELGYAITIHKAQGSEFPVIVLPLTMEHAGFLNRNLLYTAVTRARRLVVCVGQPAAWCFAIASRHALASQM